MERVLYTGPDDQVCHELAAATDGPLTLEHGKAYEVNAELADSLCESSVWFERVGAPSVETLRKQAADLGVENPAKLGKQALAAAIAAAKAGQGDSAGITGAEGEVSTDA